MNPVLQDGVDLDIAGKVQIFVDLVHRYPLSSFAESAAGTAVPFMALNAKQSNRERSISDCTRIDATTGEITHGEAGSCKMLGRGRGRQIGREQSRERVDP